MLRPYQQINRRKSRVVKVGNVSIGGGTHTRNLAVHSATNSVKDLTGYVGCSQIKRYETSNKSADFAVSFANDRSTGRISIEMLSSVTETLKAGKYFYDLIISSPEGVTERVVEGTAIVKKAVTR